MDGRDRVLEDDEEDAFRIFHVFPVSQEEEHCFISRLCNCDPRVDVFEECIVIVHNRFI